MQQRGLHPTMNEHVENPPSPTSRGRHNSKLKVLVRSHAIREEASPPRESSPNPLVSPSIKVIPSSESSPLSSSPAAHPLVVVSPSLSRVNSPSLSPVCVSPTSTLVPSPTSRCSPQNVNDTNRVECEDDGVSSAKYLSRLNKQNLERDSKKENASHLNNRKKIICDCSSQSCIKCVRSQERSINNNLTNFNNNIVPNSNTLTVNRVNSKNKLRQQSSSQGSFEGSSSASPCLSRDSSSEQYTDTSGADLEVFIPETLNRNAKDRAFMLRIEQELVNLAKDKVKTHYKFPPMSSYQRMLVHRCAAYFGMDHNIESSGKCVVVNKTKNTRIPDIEFKEHIREDIIFSEEPKRSILKRDSNSIEDYSFKSPDRQYSMENRRSKSFEEREEEYAKVRRRIFNKEELCYLRQLHDDGSHDDFEWAEMPWSSTDSENSSKFRLQLPEHTRRMAKLSKVLSEETTGETLRPHVAKSHSFGGYAGVLNRGDSIISTHSAGPRLLTKQDSGASSVSWRLSPSSSGYKSQSQMSESITPSPTSTPMCDTSKLDSHPDMDHIGREQVDSRIIWAVTDIHRVPKGSIIINPETGEPLKNEDGSVYHYDPNNLPPELVHASKPPPSPKKTFHSKRDGTSSPTKRSKSSPIHKSHVTNSSTSPSLPYSPPLISMHQPNRGLQFAPGFGDNLSQQYPVYGTGYSAPSGHDGVPMYQQPCIVYTTPYGMPVAPSFEGRMFQEPQPINDLGGTYFMSVSDNSAPTQQPVTYQQPPSSYWNQQQPISFYPSPQTPNPTPPQRFAIHPQNQANYMSSFSQNYLPPTAQPPLPPPPPNPDLLSVFPQQSMQLVYSTQANQTNPVMYPSQSNILYTQNPLYPNHLYSSQTAPLYPQNTSTPNSCAASAFPVHTQEPTHQNVMQLAQSMAQMTFAQNQQNHQNYMANKMTPASHFDIRQKPCTSKSNNKFPANSKGLMLGSSQSSTGTNSPAATVITGYCPQGSGLYRTPPETPPNQLNYGPGFPMPPVLFRQMSTVRATTPGTGRSSRSPTPAGDICHFERPRVPPPALYHGMQYMLPADNRIMSGRSQPNPYRYPSTPVKQSYPQASENKNHKGRKSKGINKMPAMSNNTK